MASSSYQEGMAMICEFVDIPNVRVTKYQTQKGTVGMSW